MMPATGKLVAEMLNGLSLMWTPGRILPSAPEQAPSRSSPGAWRYRGWAWHTRATGTRHARPGHPRSHHCAKSTTNFVFRPDGSPELLEYPLFRHSMWDRTFNNNKPATAISPSRAGVLG